MLVQLAHLKSYEQMGIAAVTCESGCVCPPTRFDGHHAERSSVTLLHNFYVSQAAECVLRVTVLQESSSSGGEGDVVRNKVKLLGVIVSEAAGEQEGVQETDAVGFVHDTATQADGMYDVRKCCGAGLRRKRRRRRF